MTTENINFFVKMLALNNYTATETHTLLHNVLGDDCVKLRRIQQLAAEYKQGRNSVEPGTKMNFGRPREVQNVENALLIRDIIEEDSRASTRYIADQLGLSKTAVHNMITEELGLRSVMCRWVPYSLTENQKANRVTTCTELLETIERRNARQRLWVIDEKWVYLQKLYTGNHARCWVGPEGDKAELVRKSMCVKKRMIMVAGNFSGQFYFEVLEDGGSINAHRYIQFIANCLRHLQDIGTPAERVMWMHDNARPHVARMTVQFLDDNVVSRVRQPPYSPDLNLMDRYIFRNFENNRLGVDFANVNELRENLTQFLASMTQNKLNKEFLALRDHCRSVIAAGGSYLT